LVLESDLGVPVLLIACRPRLRGRVLVASDISGSCLLLLREDSDRISLIHFMAGGLQSYLVSNRQLSLVRSLASRDRLAHDTVVFVDLLRSIPVVPSPRSYSIGSSQMTNESRVCWASKLD
jgi:hypothetical protein